MKRFLALILACLLLCTPVLAETTFPDVINAEAAPICGVWTLTTLITGGVAINPALYGMSMTLTFNIDGSFSSDNGQQTTTAAWQVANGVITAGNATLSRLEDGTLSLVSGGNTMIFTQTERFDVQIAPTLVPTPVPTSVPTETPASTLSPSDARAPFCGVWTLTSLITGGATLNPTLYGLTMTLTFNTDGTFVSDDGKQSTTAAWQVVNGVITAGNATLTPVEDGTLSLVSGSNTMIFTQTERFTAVVEATPAPALTPAATPAPTATPSPEDVRAPFSGTWTLSSVINGGVTLNPALYGMSMTLTFNADGSFVSDDGKQATTSSWQITDGVITAGNATLTPGEDGALTLVSGSNTMIFTRLQAPVTPAPTPTPAPTATLPPEIEALVGTWYMCYCGDNDLIGMVGDLRILGVTGKLTLQPNHTGRYTILLEGMAYVDETGTWITSDGVSYFGTDFLPLTLLEATDGPFLRYGTETDYMVFHRSEDAVWTPNTTSAAAAPLQYNVPYYCTSYSAYGFVMPFEEDYGIFSVTFQQNGQCSITMLGMPTLYQPYTFIDGAYKTNYMGESLSFVPTSVGLDLSMDGMTLNFTPVQASP